MIIGVRDVPHLITKTPWLLRRYCSSNCFSGKINVSSDIACIAVLLSQYNAKYWNIIIWMLIRISIIFFIRIFLKTSPPGKKAFSRPGITRLVKFTMTYVIPIFLYHLVGCNIWFWYTFSIMHNTRLILSSHIDYFIWTLCHYNVGNWFRNIVRQHIVKYVITATN